MINQVLNQPHNNIPKDGKQEPFYLVKNAFNSCLFFDIAKVITIRIMK
jgi:hypothetical protein